MAVPVLAGIVLGVVSRIGDRVADFGLAWFFNIAGPWVVVAYALGDRGRSYRDGVLRGVLALTTGVVSYYAFVRFVEGRAGIAYHGQFGPQWIPFAIVGGAVFGAAGYARRSGGQKARVLSVATLGGFLMGEGWAWLVRAGSAGDFVFAAELAAGAVLPWILIVDRANQWRAWWRTLAIALATAVFVIVIREVMLAR